jgi:DUF2971 family protein
VRRREEPRVEDLKDLKNELAALEARTISDLQALQTAPPRELFHYTTVQGLLGIIGSNRMWATHAAYLNDASELAYAHSLFESAVSRASASESSKVGKVFLERCVRAIDPFDKTVEFYLVCFCDAGNLLSQWRSYANRGGGCAIGIVPKEVRLGRTPGEPVILRKVTYDRVVQEGIIGGLVESALKVLKKHAPDDSVENNNFRIAATVQSLRGLLAECHVAFKDPAFEEECEWRLIFATNITNSTKEYLQFRATGALVVPYVELDLSPSAGVRTGRLPISSVTLGPTSPGDDIARDSVYALLRKHGHTFAEVRRSLIPLR